VAKELTFATEFAMLLSLTTRDGQNNDKLLAEGWLKWFMVGILENYFGFLFSYLQIINKT